MRVDTDSRFIGLGAYDDMGRKMLFDDDEREYWRQLWENAQRTNRETQKKDN